MVKAMRDWEKEYEAETAPWDTGRPSAELRRVIEGGLVPPGRALDLGCGTGTNVVYLAERGFEVTGIDVAHAGLEGARARAREAGVEVDLRRGDVLDPGDLGEPFDFIFDRGCFHVFQDDTEAARYVEMLEAVSRPGTVYLMLCGNAKEPREGGPPVLSEEQIRGRLESLFAIESLGEFRFGRKNGDESEGEGALGYACFMRRREV